MASGNNGPLSQFTANGAFQINHCLRNHILLYSSGLSGSCDWKHIFHTPQFT